MGVIASMSVTYGRRMDIFSLLLIVCMGYALYDPLILNYDISFQLSFLAML